jgi:CheY-like chemotaxis protein/HPt (histidine-containing phosphotransfer) domain-containing protein
MSLWGAAQRLLGLGNSPYAPAPWPPDAPPAALPPLFAAAGRPRVLLVEDTLLNQQVAAGMLRELGCQVEVAANGRQALGVLADPERGARLALVLMDCQMPELDGYETTAAIRRLEAGGERRLPIVAMTASAMQGDRERCLAAGMNDYVAKPVSFDQLAAVVRRWLPAPRPSAEHPPAPPAVIDQARLNEIEQRLGASDGGDLASELLEVFRSEGLAKVESLRAAIRADNAGALRRAAHALRGNASLLGASEVVELSSQLEQLGRGGTTRDAARLLPALEAAFDRVCSALGAAAAR